MCKEYISTSVPAIRKMALTLGNFDMEDAEVEVEMEPVTEVEVAGLEKLKKADPLKVETVVSEVSGISPVVSSIQKSIESSIASVPSVRLKYHCQSLCY